MGLYIRRWHTTQTRSPQLWVARRRPVRPRSFAPPWAAGAPTPYLVRERSRSTAPAEMPLACRAGGGRGRGRDWRLARVLPPPVHCDGRGHGHGWRPCGSSHLCAHQHCGDHLCDLLWAFLSFDFFSSGKYSILIFFLPFARLSRLFLF